MADVSYRYDVIDDFLNDLVNGEALQKEIEDSAISSAVILFVNVMWDGVPLREKCDIWFDGPLSPGDEVLLDAVVAAHTGDPLPEVHPIDATLQPQGLFLQTEAVASVVGEVRYDGTKFSLYDASGEFDPRSGGISEAQHKVLRHLIHFIDEGPAEGFTSGAYKETTPTGPFPTSVIWWESSAKLKKIVERTVTWTGPNPTTDKWEIYDTDGITKLATVIDSITYSSIFETSRTRTITVP